MTIRTIRAILEVVEEGESYAYALHKRTGISLDYMYKILPQLLDAGLLRYVGESEGRKYVGLTPDGQEFVNLHRRLEANISKSHDKKVEIKEQLAEYNRILASEDPKRFAELNSGGAEALASATQNRLESNLYKEHARRTSTKMRSGLTNYGK